VVTWTDASFYCRMETKGTRAAARSLLERADAPLPLPPAAAEPEG